MNILSSVDVSFLKQIYSISITTAVLVALLEIFLWDDDWKKKYASDERVRILYGKAVLSNAKHYLFIGPMSYAIMTAHVSSIKDYMPSYVAIPGVLLVQSIGYALAHAWMHIPSNYCIHKYHHAFNEKTFVRPVVANSVTNLEFFVAYCFPIIVGTLLFRPSREHMYVVTMCISSTNLLIHTPTSVLSMDFLPDAFCSNKKHFHHHEKDVRSFYSAPIFDMDGILGFRSKKKE